MALKSVLTNKVLTRVVRFMCVLLTLESSCRLFTCHRSSYWFPTRLEWEFLISAALLSDSDILELSLRQYQYGCFTFLLEYY